MSCQGIQRGVRLTFYYRQQPEPVISYSSKIISQNTYVFCFGMAWQFQMIGSGNCSAGTRSAAA